jgi:hypothetical protein
MDAQCNSNTFIRSILWILLLGAASPQAHADNGVMTLTPQAVAGDASLSNPLTICISGGVNGLFVGGRPITWIANVGASGTATIDGHQGVSGTLNSLTDNNGCATVSSIVTKGLPTTGGLFTPTINFKATVSNFGTTNYSANLGLNVALSMSVNQNNWYGDVSPSVPVQVSLRNLNAAGTVTDIPVYANCVGDFMTASIDPLVQHATGSSNPSTLNFTLYNSGGEIAATGAATPSATCTLYLGADGPTQTVIIHGRNICSLTRLSPPDPRCGGPAN